MRAALISTLLLLVLPLAASATSLYVNGYRRVERVVAADRFDLRGGSLSITEGGLPGRGATAASFAQDGLWSELRSGAIVAVADDVLIDSAHRPTNGLGRLWWVRVQATTTGSARFVTARAASVPNGDEGTTIRDALSRVSFGETGGSSEAVAAADSLGVWRLEADPSDSLEPSPQPPSGAEGYSEPRSVLEPAPLAATLLGVAVAGAALVLRQRAKRAARRARP